MTRHLKIHSLSISLVLITILLSGMVLQTSIVHAINTPWLSVSGRFIKDPQGNNVVLRGVSLVDVAVADTHPRNARQLIDLVTDDANGWYAHVVRLPVYPNAIDGQPGWISNPDNYFNNHLDPAVQECVARQIYCIVDWHYISDYSSSTIDRATRAFWTYVAPKYANTPNVIFELYNEPINPDNWSTWKATAQPWVDLIRSFAPNNLILIGGPRWSQNLSSAPSQPFTGSNLVYVAHIYPEHGGQSTWDSWFGNAANSVPFFITEWGWQQGGATPTNGTLSGYGIPFSNYLESKGLSWTAWVFDQYWQPVMFDQDYKLLGSENYMGQYTKDFLAQHHNDNLPGSSGPANPPTHTNTSSAPASTPTGPNMAVSSGNLKVQLHLSGSDNTQRSDFYYRVVNTGSSPQSNISVRIYFTLDGSQAASNYKLEKWWDQSNVAAVSGPTQASGSTYYFTVNYGSASLAAGASWEYQSTLHLNDWSNNLTAANDWWHTTGTLPSAYTDWSNIPAYVSGSRVWGSEPGGGPTNTPAGATFTPTGTNTPTGPTFTPSRAPATPPQGTHLDNPFAGATFYHNVDYVAAVNAAADLQGGTLGGQMRQVANYPTFVWLDSIAAVNGTNGYPRSLTGHLDAALAQGANAIGIVIYDLPNRDCSALASNGELQVAQNGLNRYKSEYIDAIFNTISQAKYSNLRIVMVIEPDSLPNLVTNLSFARCSEAQSSGAYVQGIQYAIGTLRSLNNTYAYIDVAHAAWLGWPSNFGPFVTLLKQVGAGIPGGNSKVDGFISNTSGYDPVDEPYMDANTMVSGQPVRSLQGWYDWNDYIDEQPYILALRNALTTGSNAYPTSIGLIIDTSRNGWGGPNRPTAASTSTDLRTFVMATRIDKRIHKGNWCNQAGAGIGARPTANPVTGIDAFVWVKPPGESDGSSSLIPTGPDNPSGKGFDRMCDPTYTGNALNGNNLTGALPNAPISGRWFQNLFVQLVQNAYPAFP
ncbi:MAG TPA: glycoside hydrolase family 6 protein [Anaerolineales bacterium]|nr:glycoside hydrolase family 6 protein [Anaerolineales bacterium]